MGRQRNSEALNPEIVKIRLGELEAFCGSAFYRQSLVKPITPSRAASYLANPDGMPEDAVLYMALIDGRMVAFRSLFAGVANARNGKIRFGWCSGSWVDPSHRRQGLSLLLLKVAYNDWEGRLMFTNYAPESESLYLKTGWFKPVFHFEGVRGYLFPKTEKLFPALKETTFAKLLFPAADFVTGAISHSRIIFYKAKKSAGVRYELMEHPDDECLRFINRFNGNYLFNRRAGEIKWIINAPWISENNRGVVRDYPFSACSETFYYRTVKVLHEEVLEGVFLFSVRDGHLKTLYFWLPPVRFAGVAAFIKNFATENRLEMLTVYHREIAGLLTENRFPVLYVKKMGQKVYASFSLDTEGSLVVQDGDGDRAFT